jgi:hypothetical protein
VVGILVTFQALEMALEGSPRDTRRGDVALGTDCAKLPAPKPGRLA